MQVMLATSITRGALEPLGRPLKWRLYVVARSVPLSTVHVCRFRNVVTAPLGARAIGGTAFPLTNLTADVEALGPLCRLRLRSRHEQKRVCSSLNPIRCTTKVLPYF